MHREIKPKQQILHYGHQFPFKSNQSLFIIKAAILGQKKLLCIITVCLQQEQFDGLLPRKVDWTTTDSLAAIDSRVKSAFIP